MATQPQKVKYQVYRIRRSDDGLGKITDSKELVGETFAISAKKAICNVKYRIGATKISDSYARAGANVDTYEAVPA